MKDDAPLIADIKPQPTKSYQQKGIVEITLDDGIKIKAVGLIYGMEHLIQGEGFSANLFLDHYSQRIRVSYYEGNNVAGLVQRLCDLAEANNFDKIIITPSERDWQAFLNHGFVLEAVIKYYLLGKNAYVMSKFRSQDRLISQSLMDEILLVEKLMATPPRTEIRVLDEGYECRLAIKSDIPELAKLYSEIFESYPSPLSHEEYLQTVFQKMNLFAVITHNKKIIAAASAELNPAHKAAELTDCATLKSYRGNGFMMVILEKLQAELVSRDYICGYTMARARSFGMNMVFYNLGYEFMGRLINNCDIYGAYEDMNIWVRDLRKFKAKLKPTIKPNERKQS